MPHKDLGAIIGDVDEPTTEPTKPEGPQSTELTRSPAKYTSRINLTTTSEQLTDLKLASAADRIEVTARLRAMITLWQTDERHRKRVDKLALECR